MFVFLTFVLGIAFLISLICGFYFFMCWVAVHRQELSKENVQRVTAYRQ